MRLLGVHPGPLMYTKVFLRLEPLGLELVAQALRRAGHQVRLIDLQVEDHRAYFRLLQSWRPEIVAFSCNYLANVPEIVDLAKATKARFPEIFVCVGGHSVSFVAERVLEHAEGAIVSAGIADGVEMRAEQESFRAALSGIPSAY